MKAVLKLMIFSILLNLSCGILSYMIPSLANDPANQFMTFDQNALEGFKGDMNGTITPSGAVQASTSSFFSFYRILDSIGLGVIGSFIKALGNAMFGFNNLVYYIVGVDNQWFKYFFNSLLSIGYSIGAIWLWTSKDIGRG
jgi:hypothetical protein